MNEKIRELALLAERYTNDTVDERVHNRDFTFGDIDEVYNTKFAELIVKECVTNIVHDTANWPGDEGEMAYYQGVQDAVKSIRKHFGEK